MTPAKKVTLPNFKRGRGRPKGSRNKPKTFSPAPKRARQQQPRGVPPAATLVDHPPPYLDGANSQSGPNVIVVDDTSEEDEDFSTESDDEDINHMEWDAWDWMDVCMMVRHIGSTARPYVRSWTKEQRARIANAFRECATIFDPK
ncbi:hypothetical protein CF326_g7894 [Tilletia indica]|nr:hypothetical protein CF326_g7894 [Tilletia indica]